MYYDLSFSLDIPWPQNGPFYRICFPDLFFFLPSFSNAVSNGSSQRAQRRRPKHPSFSFPLFEAFGFLYYFAFFSRATRLALYSYNIPPLVCGGPFEISPPWPWPFPRPPPSFVRRFHWNDLLPFPFPPFILKQFHWYVRVVIIFPLVFRPIPLLSPLRRCIFSRVPPLPLGWIAPTLLFFRLYPDFFPPKKPSAPPFPDLFFQAFSTSLFNMFLALQTAFFFEIFRVFLCFSPVHSSPGFFPQDLKNKNLLCCNETTVPARSFQLSVLVLPRLFFDVFFLVFNFAPLFYFFFPVAHPQLFGFCRTHCPKRICTFPFFSRFLDSPLFQLYFPSGFPAFPYLGQQPASLSPCPPIFLLRLICNKGLIWLFIPIRSAVWQPAHLAPPPSFFRSPTFVRTSPLFSHRQVALPPPSDWPPPLGFLPLSFTSPPPVRVGFFLPFQFKKDCMGGFVFAVIFTFLPLTPFICQLRSFWRTPSPLFGHLSRLYSFPRITARECPLAPRFSTFFRHIILWKVWKNSYFFSFFSFCHFS